MKKFLLMLTSVMMLVGFAGCKQAPEEEHEHTFAEEWTSDETGHWHKATCEHSEEVSDFAEHSFDEGKVTLEPTDSNEGEKTFTCTVCGFKKIEKIDAKGHNFDETTWKTDENNHWHECTCGEKKDLAAHEENPEPEIIPATCTQTGTKTYRCSICGYVIRIETIEKDSNKHDFDETTWKTDGVAHWHECKREGCTVIKDKVAHTYGDLVYNKNATESKKGTMSKHCTICGFEDASSVIEVNGPYIATYTFTEDVNELKAGTDGTLGTSGKYVLFGDFPQSNKASDIEINPHAEDNGYYVGSDGNYYAKNNDKYFKVEPIKWRVLTNSYNGTGKSLLLAENELTGKIAFYDNSVPEGANHYEPSQIRAYLNGLSYLLYGNTKNKWLNKGFLQLAFTNNAQGKIAKTTVINNEENSTDVAKTWNPGVKIEETTQDKIFLLSEKEVTMSEYGFKNETSGDPARIRKPTDYANEILNINWGWMLRSPNETEGESAHTICAVHYEGWADSVASSGSESYYIVPALTISLE